MPKSSSPLSRVCAVAALLLALAETSIRAAEIVWTNTSIGDWSAAANWNPNQVPGASDNAYITNNGTYIVDISATASVATLTVGGSSGKQTLEVIGSAHLTINNPSMFGTNSALSLAATTGGAIEGPGDITVAGQFFWTAGTMQGSGRTTIASTGSLLLYALNTKLLNRTLQNDGAVVFAAGSLSLNGGFLTNNGTFTASNSVDVSFQGPGPNAFYNSPGATFTKKESGTVSFTSTALGVALLNGGTVDVQAGTLTLLRSGTNSNIMTVQSAGTILFGSGYTYMPGSSLSGSGTNAFSGGTHNFPAGTFTPTGTVNFSGGNVTIANTFSPAVLGTIGATVTFSNAVNYTGPLNITGTATFAAAQSFSVLTLSGSGTLDGAEDITVTGSLNWLSGTMQGSGRTIVANTGTFAMTNNGSKSLKRSLQNDGAAVWTAGSLGLAGATITNNGTFTVSNSAALSISGSAPGPNAFHNSSGATFTKQGTGTFQFGSLGTVLPFNNSGTVFVQAGTLRLPGGGTNSNLLNVQSAGSILFDTNYTYLPGSLLSGSGTNTFNAGTHTFPAGTFTPSGTVNFTGGLITISNAFSPGVLGMISANVTFHNTVNYAGLVNITGTALFSTAQNFNSLTLSGTLDGAGDVTVAGPLSWTVGNMNGGGKTIVANTGTLNLNTPNTKNLSRILQNNGTAAWTDGTILLSGGKFNNSGSFTVSNSTIFNFLGGPVGSNAFNNNIGGIFTKQNSGQVGFLATSTPVPFNNSGTVDVQAGTVNFNSGYTQAVGQTILSGGAITVPNTMQIQGGMVAGTGTINGNVQSSGVFSPGASPGLLTITGGYTQTSTGALNIEIAGTTSDSTFDRLAVGVTASLAGALNVVFTNGFFPATNGVFTFLTCGGRSGTFGTFNYPSNDLVMQVAYSATAASAQIVNFRPVLPAFPSQTNSELVPFNLNAAGTDADLPAQTLTYSLTNSPPGAVIDPGTGMISWTPTEAQGPMTTNITVLLKDNGTPSLTASRTFQIVIQETNAAPAFTLLDRMIHATAPLAVSATATDPDIPTNTLTFQLVSGPSGLEVTTNGLITWVPADTLATITNPVTVRVFDDGSPVLSTTQSFNVIVFPRPLLASPLLVTNNVVLSWSAIPGTSYRVQRSSNLASGTWSNLPGDVLANSTNAVALDSQAATRLYRVQVLP